VDEFVGGAGNDTFKATIDGTTAANNTLTALDALDGGDGTDILKINNTSAALNDATDLSVATISNIETINIQAVGGITDTDNTYTVGTNEVDFSSISGLETINVTKSQAALIEAADTTDVNVSGASGLISVVGGKNIVVNDTTADKTIKVGDIGNIGGDAVGTITITDTKNGSATAANNDITVEGGTDVTVTTTADKADSGDITVGNATNGEPSGTVVITQNSTSNGTAMTAGDVTVVGGSTVDITANMTNTAVKGGGTNPITAGAFDVTGGDATTEVTITQNATATDFEDDADPGTAEVTTITFGALKAGESVAISEGAQNITGTNSDDLAFTAAKDLTANQVAAAFANLTNGDTQAAGGIVDNGVFTGALDAGWTSGEASGANVTFTSTGFVNEPNLDITTDSDGDWSAISPATNNADFKIASNTNGTVAGASTAVDVSEDYGDVTISDNATASIKTITVDGYAATSTITGTTVLETLNLSNAAAAVDMTVADTAATLNLTLEKLGEIGDTKEAKLTLTAAPTTLNVTSTGDNYVDLTAAATETLNVSGTGTLDIADDDLAGLKTVKVTETAGLILTPLAHDTIESVDTTGTTGTVTATIDGTKATYAGGAGMDNLTIATAGTAVSKAIDLGKGNDTLTLVGITVAVPTETLKGGEGDDTLSIDAASAAVLDNNTNFATALDSFETLFINTAAGDDDNSADTVTLDMEALGFNSVISSGTVADTAIPANADTLVFDNMSSGATVIFLDAPADANTVQQVNIKGANSNSTDVFNGDFVFTNNYGTLTVAETETINLNSGDIATVELVANKATAVNLTGSDFILDTTGTEITSVDASELTGGLTYAADGATAGTTVKGGEGADVLIADGSQDTLIGNDGDDTLIGTSLTQMTGGDGNDTFIGGVSTNVNSASAVLDAASGDVIKLVDSTVGDMVGFNSAQITLDPSGDPDLQNYADAAIDGITADNNAAWFQYNDNTYIVMEDNNADTPGSFVNGEDVIIKLTGLVDLSEASFNATDGTLELA
jgi:S-layer protein